MTKLGNLLSFANNAVLPPLLHAACANTRRFVPAALAFTIHVPPLCASAPHDCGFVVVAVEFAISVPPCLCAVWPYNCRLVSVAMQFVVHTPLLPAVGTYSMWQIHRVEPELVQLLCITLPLQQLFAPAQNIMLPEVSDLNWPLSECHADTSAAPFRRLRQYRQLLPTTLQQLF